jgi:hypothetical protein
MGSGIQSAQACLTYAPTPSGFRNLMALHRPKPGDHYFRSHPLLGFALQSFSPPAQPHAVSDADALWPFNAKRNSRHRHDDTPRKPKPKRHVNTPE